MKACIVTFQSAYNYGAVLQAFALQKYLNLHYAKTVILDYHNDRIDKSYKMPAIKDFVKNPKNAVFRTAQAALYRGKNRKINLFRNEFLPLTKRYDKNSVNEAISEGDVFITGSDQVWNYLIVDRDSSFYLDFAKNKQTCSYAASFGVAEIPDVYRDFYKEKLNGIDFISVREEKGAELVSELCGKQADIMPDPTLLIEKSEWESMCIDPKIKGKYILVYKITKADKLISFAKDLSAKTGLPVVYIPNDLKAGTVGSLKLSVGPQEWLGYIRNAEYVVTNSFHGTVFSILFGKKFFSEMSAKVNPSTSRLSSLLNMFGLENRTLDNFYEQLLTQELSEAEIFEQQLIQRKKADAFFKKVFDGIDNETI